MATAADKRRWDKLRGDYAKARTEFQNYERELGAKYGFAPGWQTWLKKGERNKLDRLRKRADKVGDKIIDLAVRISPRGEAWLSGVPAWWIREHLTWEDAVRPAKDPLSVIVPGAYGYPDGYVREQGGDTAMEIQIPDMPMWEQIGGDMDAAGVGALIARSDGDALELLQIQPVREYVGDAEAVDVGFPFWTREGWYDLNDLSPENKDVQDALNSIGMDLDTLEADFSPTRRALVIAEALMDYGVSDEGPAGWSDDIYPDEEVKWWSGGVQTIGSVLAEEDEEFRREVLGEEEEEEEGDAFSEEEMREGYVISDARGAGYTVAHEGRHFGDFEDWDDAIEAINEDMKSAQVFMNVYYVNERGNVDLIDPNTGNIIESRV